MPVSEVASQFGDIVAAFQLAVILGLNAVQPHIRFWVAFAVFIYGMAMGVGIIRGSGSVVEWALWSVVKISVAVFLVTELAVYAIVLRDSMIRLGAVMAGSDADSIVLNPADVLLRGVQAVQIVVDMMAQASTSWVAVITLIPNMVVLGLASVGILLLYAVLALNISVALIEWAITLLFAAITIPMGIAHHAFAFLSENGIRGLINHSIRLAVLSFLAMIVNPFLVVIGLKTTDWGAALSTIFAMAVIATLFVKTPSLVAGLLSGMPRLSAGSVGSAVMSAAYMTAGVGVGGAAVAAGGIRGAVSLGAGARSLAGSTPRGAMSQVGRGIGSVASQSSFGQAARSGQAASQRFLAGQTQPGRSARIAQAFRNADRANPE